MAFPPEVMAQLHQLQRKFRERTMSCQASVHVVDSPFWYVPKERK